jgi:hypothetical protein
MKIFHYTPLEGFRPVRHEDWSYDGQKGLQPRRYLPGTNNTLALYGLLEPQPTQWTDNVEFPESWNRLQLKERVLVSIEIDEDTTNAVVMDSGHMEARFLPPGVPVPEKYFHSDKPSAEAAYIDSIIPLSDYLAKQQELKYALPEVVLLDGRIPPERLTIEPEQPMLEQGLRSVKNQLRDTLERRVVEEVPALKPWLEQFKRDELLSELLLNYPNFMERR